MKSLYLFSILFITLSLIVTQPPPIPASNTSFQSPNIQAFQGQVTYSESPSIIQTKSTPDVVISQAQAQILAPNIQTRTIINGIESPHLDHGFNLDNIDPQLEIVRAPSPIPLNDQKNIQNPGKLPNIGDEDFTQRSVEANLRLNKTHSLIKETYEKLKTKGGSMKNRKEIEGFIAKVKYFKQALNLHNNELSKAIFQNYKSLESVTQEILKIREDLLESDINQGKTKQSKQQISYLKNLKMQISKIRSLVELLNDFKTDQKMWDNPKVLCDNFPRKIVHYFDLNNQVYQVNKWIHITEKNPWNSIQILKREAYYDPTKCQRQINFVNFKQSQQSFSIQSPELKQIAELLDKSTDFSSNPMNPTDFRAAKFKSLDKKEEDNGLNSQLKLTKEQKNKAKKYFKHK